MLMVGYLEGIGSERGIAWRCADSISLREFLGYGLSKNPLEHSGLSKTRKRLSVEAHAAMRSIVRHDDGKGLRGVAGAGGGGVGDRDAERISRSWTGRARRRKPRTRTGFIRTIRRRGSRR